MNKIEKLEKQIKELRDQQSFLHKETRMEMEEYFQTNYFQDLPLTRISGYDFEDFNFERRKEGYDHPQEVCRLRFKRSNWDKKEYDDISIDYYSSGTTDEWEVTRLITIGRVAEKIFLCKNVILEAFNKIPVENNKKRSKLRSKIFQLEREIDQIKKEKFELDKTNSLNLLFSEGIEFDDENLKSCSVRNDHYVRNIKKIKFLRWTNDNKKSLNVEITTSFIDWHGNKVVETDVYNKVRLFNVDHFINLKTKQLNEELVK